MTYQRDAVGNPWLIGEEQCLSIKNLTAPCRALSVRYGVMAIEDISLVTVSSLQLTLEPSATPTACPTPTPTPIPTAQPVATPTSPSKPPSPLAEVAAPTPTPDPEPLVFPALVNGSFEQLREDGTPYGWHKVGGAMTTSAAVRAAGTRSAALISWTDSTKWLYQTVAVEGGAYYRLRAAALKNDAGAREAFLRVSWYESADGSGSQIDTADSPALADNGAAFVMLDTGPVRAPPHARSAKVRLMLRPVASSNATVYFDDVRFGVSAPPPPSATPTAAGANRSDSGGSGATASPPSASQPPTEDAQITPVSVWVGPTPLANVRLDTPADPEPMAPSGGRVPWALLLALGLPLLAFTAAAGRSLWSSRLAGRNDPHL